MSRPACSGVIFDLDGTLADTLKTIHRVVNFGLEQMACPPHSMDSIKGMVGDGIVRLCERALPPDHQDRIPELLQTVRSHYSAHRSDGASLYDGIGPQLKELQHRSIKLAVLSNKPHDLTLGTLKDLGIESMFDCILGHREQFAPKPDPAGLHWVLEQISLHPSEALYVGDTSTDMKTASAGAVASIGVTWGFRDEEELRCSGARYLVHHPRQILQILRSWNQQDQELNA